MTVEVDLGDDRDILDPGNPDTSWQSEALCAEYSDAADEWFPDKGQTASAAMKVCNGHDDIPPCPVREQCLRMAVNRGVRLDYGIWGGTTYKQRRKLRKEVSKGVPVEIVVKDYLERS